MLLCVLILILLLPVVLLPFALETLFSAKELMEMGIRFDTSSECSESGCPVQIVSPICLLENAQ